MLPIDESRRRWEQRDTSHGITARLEPANARSSRATGWRDGIAALLEWNEAQAQYPKGFLEAFEAAVKAHRQAGKARTPGERFGSR